MKKFLIQKTRVIIKFHNLDFTGSLDHIGTQEDIVRLLTHWVDKEENDENEKELAAMLFPEQKELLEKNKKMEISVRSLLSDNIVYESVIEESEKYESVLEESGENEENEDKDDFWDNEDDDEYEDYVPSYYEEEKAKAKNASKEWARDIYNNVSFYEKGNSVYMTGIPISIPDVIIERFAELKKENKVEEFAALCNFWKWVSLNPDPESRENIYAWVRKQNIPILDSGFILTFRRVVSLQRFDYKVIELVNRLYLKRKAAKKSTNFDVVEITVDENGIDTLRDMIDSTAYKNLIYEHLSGFNDPKCVDGMYKFYAVLSNTIQLMLEKSGSYYEVEDIGVLNDLYQEYNTNNKVYYTSNHDKTVKYYIGKEVRMPREDVDPNKNNTCSSGYHVSGLGFSYNGFGDTPVACIVNPRDILVVYENDYGKCRTSAFTIVGILKEDCEWANDKQMQKVISETTIDRLKDLELELANNPIFDDKLQNFYKEAVINESVKQKVNFAAFKNIG